MPKQFLIILSLATVAVVLFSFTNNAESTEYNFCYNSGLNRFEASQSVLIDAIKSYDLNTQGAVAAIKEQIRLTRRNLKGVDFWLRYLDPLAYKKINSPLPVEWETEVFEKFEKPYKRKGAGLTLAMLYIDEAQVEKDSLISLIAQSIAATKRFKTDSVTDNLKTYHHFFLCNRLFLLNLAAIYSTGFECPDVTSVIPELRSMLGDVSVIYQCYNKSFPDNKLTDEYLNLYQETIRFVNEQPSEYDQFDHFSFLKDHINPLFGINQQLINQYHVVSRSLVDYSLNKKATSIFQKQLYNGQNSKGIFIRVKDQEALDEIDRIGKLLFYDPILSGNNQRSCASCHNPKQYFTDTVSTTSLQFSHQGFLSRNSPSLINVEYNHLLMMDGKHISLQDQTKAVISNAIELGSNESKTLSKVLSCSEYSSAFKRLLKYTPQEKEITFDHIVSAITFYYTKFSKYYSPFDEAMNENRTLEASVKRGFNLFMSKAQCATCHFVPQFNGVKPPYVGSEFEVLGVPEDITMRNLSDDKGRYEINKAHETLNAFRTGTLRNASYTKPYMHNGVFKNLRQVIDFYDAGGGAGQGLEVNNQTLSSDALHLTELEKNDLMDFIQSLNEKIELEEEPEKLPLSKNKTLNSRKVGGVY
jgi:cytochrome c peroxidase